MMRAGGAEGVHVPVLCITHAVRLLNVNTRPNTCYKWWSGSIVCMPVSIFEDKLPDLGTYLTCQTPV